MSTAIELDDDLVQRIDRIAGQTGETRSGVIRAAVIITYRTMHEDKHHYTDECDWCGWKRSDTTISDGFGSVWPKCCPECGRMTMQVIRPGMAQCSECG